jgi:hypothetical protein
MFWNPFGQRKNEKSINDKIWNRPMQLCLQTGYVESLDKEERRG